MNFSSTTSAINFNTYDSRLLAAQNSIEPTNLTYSMSAEVTNPSTSTGSCEEPQYKKVKLVDTETTEKMSIKNSDSPTPGNSYINKKLEDRIGGILCCTVCLDLPQTSIYQV